MRATLLHMLSTNSLSAFSGANATAPLHRPGQARLVQPAKDMASPAPAERPAPLPPGPRPRGSLVNLSV